MLPCTLKSFGFLNPSPSDPYNFRSQEKHLHRDEETAAYPLVNKGEVLSGVSS